MTKRLVTQNIYPFKFVENLNWLFKDFVDNSFYVCLPVCMSFLLSVYHSKYLSTHISNNRKTERQTDRQTNQQNFLIIQFRFCSAL